MFADCRRCASRKPGLGPRGHERTELEYRFWAAVGSSAIGLGSKARWCCDCCRSRRGVADDTACLSTRENFTRHRTLRKGSRRLRKGRSSVVSLYGHAGAGDVPEKMRKKELLFRDTFQFPSTLHRISLWPFAQPLTLEAGQTAQHWLLKRQPVHPLRHALCMRDLGTESMWCLRIVSANTRFVMLVWWATQAYPRICPLPLCSSLQSVSKSSQRLCE